MDDLDPWQDMARRIGLRVRDLRHRRGLSQAGLCLRIAKLGAGWPKVDRTNLSHLERGASDRGVATIRTLVAVARGLSVPLGTLLVGVDDHIKGRA